MILVDKKNNTSQSQENLNIKLYILKIVLSFIMIFYKSLN